jgi:hypothetical protein
MNTALRGPQHVFPNSPTRGSVLLRRAVLALPLLAALLLNACGGGGGGTSSTTAAPQVVATSDTLTVTASGSGTITSNPAGVSCATSCSAQFPAGTAVTLTAQSAAGYSFHGWGDSCSGSGNCSVTVSSALSVTAAFTSNVTNADYVLSLNTSGNGTVTSNPSGINCQASCSAAFPAATTVTLTAQAASGQQFAGWSGACSGTATCTITMGSNQTLGASFTPVGVSSYDLTFTQTGIGSVSVSPNSTTCTASCTASFASGTAVTLNAQPGTGYTFAGWGGACSGTTSCNLTMTAAQAVSAAFAPVTPNSYTLLVNTSGSGTVSSSPGGISCGSTCSASYASGTVVTLTAQAASGYNFSGWTGSCSGTAACSVTLNAASTVGASFTAVPASYTLTVASPGSGGTVTSSSGGISCGSTCSSSFTVGTAVTLSASAASGYTFAGWSGACTGAAASCSLTMNAASSVSASFSANAVVYALTVTQAGTGTGTTSSTPVGISCGSACSYSFASGTAVTLSAQAASGSTFSGWSGACTGSGTCSVSLSATRAVTATYTLNSSGGTALSIHVSGNHLVDGNGNTVQLRGVNVSGLEGVAIGGWSPSNAWGSVTGTPTPNWTTIKTWGVNAVRLPLNEASWLGLTCADDGGYGSVVTNGVKVHNVPGQIVKADPGGNYQSTVATSVAEATAAGLYVIIDLHLAAPGNLCPMAQNAMADADHSIAFWTSLATMLKTYPNVIFELFNEPFLDMVTLTNNAPWTDLINGGGTLTSFMAQTPSSPWQMSVAFTWQNAGMQQMLDAVRATGATNVILTSTLGYAGSIGGWLQYHPTDSLNPSQIGAVWHAYPASATYPAQVGCTGGLPACSAQTMAAAQAIMAAGYPVVLTEFGDPVGGTSAPLSQVLLPFADTNGISYMAWTWDIWPGTTYYLITDAAGTPTAGYGAYVKAHYLCRAAGTTSCP